jgi:cytochrome c oxidase subunit 2
VTIPNTRSYLARWITGSQHYKPGNEMPDLQLTGQKLHALVAYLETLK